MLRHILIPLDGSALAEKALDFGQRIIDPQGKVTLLTVLPRPQLPLYPDVGDHDRESTRTAPGSGSERAQHYMERMATNMKLSGIGDVAVEIMEGEPADVIVERASKLGVEAIVMSSHGRSGISRLLFGSITLKVLTDAPCPVTVVPNREQERTPEAQTADNPALNWRRTPPIE